MKKKTYLHWTRMKRLIAAGCLYTVLSVWPLRNSQTVSNTLMTSNVFTMSDCYNYFDRLSIKCEWRIYLTVMYSRDC